MNTAERINLQVNGEDKTCSLGNNLSQFLQEMRLNPRLVAVEYNGEIIHRQYWDNTILKIGDRLEIVTIVVVL